MNDDMIVTKRLGITVAILIGTMVALIVLAIALGNSFA